MMKYDDLKKISIFFLLVIFFLESFTKMIFAIATLISKISIDNFKYLHTDIRNQIHSWLPKLNGNY